MLYQYRKGKWEHDVRPIPESGGQPCCGYRGSFLAEVTSTQYDASGMEPMQQRVQNKRFHYDESGNVYLDCQSKKVLFKLG